MAEPSATKTASPEEVYAEIGGVPVKLTPQQAQEHLAQGGGSNINFISKEQAEAGAGALKQIQAAHEKYGYGGEAAMGVASGLTLGLGPPIAARLGMIDPNELEAISTTGAFTAGDVAGTVLPAFFSGGESLALRGSVQAGGRGLLGTAMAATPAGLMGRLGGATGAFAERFLPKAGPIASTALKMAASGATEGALINMSHTMGDAILHDKPLSAQAMLGSGADGALLGGFVGGGFGVVGGIGSAVAGKVSGGIGKAMGGKYPSATARAVGMSAEDVAADVASGGNKLKEFRQVLTDEGSGVTYGSGATAIREAAERQGKIYSNARAAVVEELDAGARAYAPQVIGGGRSVLDTFYAESVAPKIGTISEKRATAFFGRLGKEIGSIEAPLDVPRPVTWGSWVKSRDALESRIASGEYSGLEGQMAKDALRVIDRSMRDSMDAAEKAMSSPGLSQKFQASQAGMLYARELEATVGKKAARDLLANETTFTPRDLAVFGGMAAIGHPGTALGWMAAKGVGRRVNKWLEPALAESAFQSSIGARAAGAEQRSTLKIRDSIRNFFKRAAPTPRRAISSVQATTKTQRFDRKSYEEAASRTEQLLSANHQAKVQKLVDGLSSRGYEQFAKEIWLTNQRAVQYLQMNTPPRRAAGQLGSLRKAPQIHGTDMGEMKFLRILNGVTKPLSILDKLEDGSVSREEVRAVKYVYPDLHAKIVEESANHIAEMKANGEYMPMDKIANLGLVLDAPIDSMLEGSRIDAIQASFVPPEPPPQGPPPQPAFSAQTLQTPLESLT